MIRSLGSWSVVLVSGALAFLVYLARGWLDWRFVYGDFVADDDILTTLLVLVFYSAIAAAWTWSLVAAGRERRGGAMGLLVLSLLLLVLGGIGTSAALCSWPCDTAWPLMELSNSGGIVIGLVATVAAARRITLST